MAKADIVVVIVYVVVWWNFSLFSIQTSIQRYNCCITSSLSVGPNQMSRFEILTRNYIHLPAIIVGVTKVHNTHCPSITSFSNNNIGKRYFSKTFKWSTISQTTFIMDFFFFLDVLFQFWPLTQRQDIAGEFKLFSFTQKGMWAVILLFSFWSLTQSCKMSSLVT